MKDKRKVAMIIFLLVLCFAYLIVRGAQGAYESIVSATAHNNIANWSIKVNNQEITNNSNTIDLTYTMNTLNNIRDGKVGPGAVLTYPVTIDASSSDVAILLTFSIKDKTIDSEKYLTLTDIESSNLTIVRTGPSAYSTIIDKSSLSTIKNLTLVLEWIDDGSLIEYNEETTSDSFVEINLNAIQYTGETLVQYNE